MLETNSSITHPAVPTLDKLIQFFLFMFAASSMFSISITQISFTAGALCWILKVHLTQTWKEIRSTQVGTAIFCFCLACFLATATAVDLESSFKHLQKLLQFIIFFWVINAVHDEKQRNLLIRTIIIAGVISALYGLYVHFQADFSIASKPTGTRSNPATFAGGLMLTSLVVLSWYLFYKPKKNWVLGSLGVLTYCLLITLTRQAWLGFFIGGIFLLFVWNKKYLLIGPLLLASLFLFAPDHIKDRIHSFGSIEESSFQSRVSLWKGGWTIFKDYPITGCGFKCVDAIHSQYPDPSGWIKFFRGMHNNILQLLVDTGIIGLGFWVLIWVAFFIEIFKRMRGLTEETSHGN
ncbi:MAG: O-antigen ligase family protein, partial [Nitrospinaceae bacterium]